MTLYPEKTTLWSVRALLGFEKVAFFIDALFGVKAFEEL